jgi:type II secretory pathway pseudopilin PulG
MKNLANNLGISILEVVVSIMIIAMGMVGVLSLVIQNVEAQYINKNVLMASGLAQEGLELVRNIRDLNWLTVGNTWNQNMVNDGTYTIDYGGRSSINLLVNSLDEAGARLYVNSNGLYTHTVTATATNFYRLITVVDYTNYLDVKCAIRWTEGSQKHDYTAETYLYDWR